MFLQTFRIKLQDAGIEGDQFFVILDIQNYMIHRALHAQVLLRGKIVDIIRSHLGLQTPESDR